MHFANPHILWLLLLIVPIIANYILRTLRNGTTINISTLQGVKNAPRTYRYWLRHLPIVLRTLAIAAIVVALARPQEVEQSRNSTAEGIDIVMALDVSGSMLAQDFEPDRITAAKSVATSFIGDRLNDRISIVVFAGEAFTQSPLTTDKASLQTLLSTIRSGVIKDGTAIGDGLATALNRLRESDAKSKVVILLTDGVNNSGSIAPLTAAQIAKEMGVKVYTIGVGTQGMAPYPRIDPYGDIVDYVQAKVEIDEEVLTTIAKETGGEYFRATNNDKLKAIYEQINTLEKSEVEVTERTIYHELYLPWALFAMSLLLLEFFVIMFILKKLP